MRYYISIEKNIETFENFKVLWKNIGVQGIRADTMNEGIEKAIEIEKSKVDELYFIVIVADDIIGYMNSLKILAEETISPILVVTYKPNEDEREKALNIGADYYGEYCEIPEKNIYAAMAAITSIERRSKKPKPSSKVIIYRGIMLAPSYRNTVFIGSEKIELTRQEFDILYYLMVNHGKTLSYKQIYRRVWGGDYEDTERNVLWNAINRIREKLKAAPDGKEYIETVRDYGYRFPD